MKICPICDARAFDDAPICYGCLYRFDEEECSADNQPSDAWADCASDEGAKVEALAPEFLIRFTPVAGAVGTVTWSCAVEVADGRTLCAPPAALMGADGR